MNLYKSDAIIRFPHIYLIINPFGGIYFRKSIFLNFILFNFTILYWFCHISKWICHRYTCVPHPEPSSLPIPSLWVVPVHQPQASSIVHRTWTGDSFHLWYYAYFNAILPNHPTLSLSHRVQKTVLYISVSFAVSYTEWHPTPVLLPGKSHGWRSLEGCSPWGCWVSDMTEQLPFHFSLSCIGEGNGNPLQCSCLENPRDGGAWWTAVYGVAESLTRLKQLSSSSSIQSYCYHLSKFHIYALVYCIGVFLSGLLHSV